MSVAGRGTVALRLAPLFEAVVGLDPDAGMLDRASRAAARLGIGNASWVCQRAEALPAGLGSFRAVTFAASFHWMDRPRVASTVATMLDPGGAVLQVDAPGYRPVELAAEARQGSLPFPPPPDEALDQVERTADDVVALVFSTSSTAPHLFGDRREDCERDVRQILAHASASGRFSVRLPDNIVRIWRLPA